MLYQLHHQFKDGHTEMMAQCDTKEFSSLDREYHLWVAGVMREHPCPEGAQWLVCNEKSEFFEWATGPGKPSEKESQ